MLSALFLVAPLAFFPATFALPRSVALSPEEDVDVQRQGGPVTTIRSSTLEDPSNSPRALPSSSRPGGVSTNGITTSSNTTVESSSSGYRNALYFTNWCGLCLMVRRWWLTNSGVSMEPTINPSSYQPTSLLMCSMPLPILPLMERCKWASGTQEL